MTGNASTDVAITLTSSDPSKMRFSLASDGDVSDSIVVSIPTGHSLSTEFYVQALSNVGSVGYTATAPGFGAVNGTVTLASSGFVIQSPTGVGAPSFQAPVGVGSVNLTISTGRLNSSGGFAETQLVASGASISVTVASGTTSVGTISSSPITIAGGSSSASASLQPVAIGSTTVTVTAPQFAPAQVVATFVTSTFIVDNAVTVGKNLQEVANIVLLTPAGPSGVQFTVVSNPPSSGPNNLNLAAASTDAGAGTIIVTIPAGGNSAQFFVQALADSGSGTYTVSSPGMTSVTGTATFAKSGFVIQLAAPSQSLASLTTTATVTAVRLTGTNSPSSPQALAGPLSLDVSVQSGNSGVATVPATVTIQPGFNNATVNIGLVSAGTSSISVSQPSGFTTPASSTFQTLTVTP